MVAVDLHKAMSNFGPNSVLWNIETAVNESTNDTSRN